MLREDDLFALLTIGNELASRIDLKELLNEILVKAGKLTDSPDGSIILYSEERKFLYFAEAIGSNAQMLLSRFAEDAKQLIPVKGSIAGRVFEEGETVVEHRVEEDPEHFKGVDNATGKATASMICVQLSASSTALGPSPSDGVSAPETPLGVIQVLNKRSGDYDERDILILEHLATQAAIAIRNARLFGDLVAQMGLYGPSRRNVSVVQTLKELKSPPKSESVSVLFADMRGFRALCQSPSLRNERRLLKILNEYTEMLSGAIHAHEGIVNKFLGDGVLALFRDSDHDRDSDHERRSVLCAFEITTLFDDLKAKWDSELSEDISFIDVGIGIASDEVILGTIGTNRVRDFTAIGTAVNLAAAFEQCARNGKRIMVDNPTFQKVRDFVADIEGPFTYELRQPDQQFGAKYKQYHLRRLVAEPKAQVFISHSHKDRVFVENRLIPACHNLKIKTWYSNNDLNGGDRWLQALTTALDRSQYLIVVVSAASAETKSWVGEEIAMAANNSDLRRRIIPVIIDDTTPDKVHVFLGTFQGIRYKENADLESQLGAAFKRFEEGAK